MTNNSYVWLSLAMVVINLAFLILEVRNAKRLPCAKYMVGISISIITWGILYALFYFDPDPIQAVNWHAAKFLYASFTTVFFLLFLLSYLNPATPLGKGVVFNLMIVPVVEMIVLLVAPLRAYFIHSVAYESLNPRQLVYQYGFLYYIHVAYTCAIAVISAVIAYRNLRKSSSFQRLVYFALFLSPLLVVGYYVVILFFRAHIPFDSTLVVATISNYLLVWASLLRKDAFFLLLTKDTAFAEMSSFGLIVDNEDIIVSANRHAAEVLSPLEGQYMLRPYREVMAAWKTRCNGRVVRDDHGELLQVDDHEGRQRYYRIIERESFDGRGHRAGMFVEMPDVTVEHELIARLYDLINKDKLTGASSRRHFLECLETWNRADNLPLCVIYGDVNKLKYANDTFGHEVGDELLKTIVELLQRPAQNSWLVARIGGDEFAVLAPHTDEAAAAAYISAVERSAARVTLPHGIRPSISLGFAVKHGEEEDIRAILQTADKNMYENKVIYRQRQENK